MKQFTKNERILIFIIGALLFIFVFNSLIIAPLRGKLKETEEDIARLQLLLRKYSGLENEKELIVKAYKQIERYLSLQGSDDEKMTLILSRIESEARKNELTIVDMKPDVSNLKLKSKDAAAARLIRMNAEADIRKILNFLQGLENAEIFLTVDKIILSVKDEETRVMKFEAVIMGISI